MICWSAQNDILIELPLAFWRKLHAAADSLRQLTPGLNLPKTQILQTPTPKTQNSKPKIQIATFLHRVRGLTIGYSCYDLFAITNASMSNVSIPAEVAVCLLSRRRLNSIRCDRIKANQMESTGARGDEMNWNEMVPLNRVGREMPRGGAQINSLAGQLG